MDYKIAFLYAAINDCQSTIRAIDTKLGALLAAILVPISVIDKIWSVIESFINAQDHILATISGYAFFIIWGIIVLVLVRTLSAISNPKIHIQGSNSLSGAFYCGGQFSFNLLDIILNRKSIQSKDQISVIATRHPKEAGDIQKELVFEQMKLVYIRDIKLHRLKSSIFLALTWAFSGLIIYAVTKLQ